MKISTGNCEYVNDKQHWAADEMHFNPEHLLVLLKTPHNYLSHFLKVGQLHERVKLKLLLFLIN